MNSGGDVPSLVAFESALARLSDALVQPKTEWTRDVWLLMSRNETERE